MRRFCLFRWQLNIGTKPPYGPKVGSVPRSLSYSRNPATEATTPSPIQPSETEIVEPRLNDASRKDCDRSLEDRVKLLAGTSESATQLRVIWGQLRALKKKPSPSFYEHALAVLAIHPDHLLRMSIFTSLKNDWIDAGPNHNAYYLVGLLRDGQYELALDILENIRAASRNTLPTWVYDIFVLVYGQKGFVAEAVKLLEYRRAQAVSTPEDFAHFLLDACSSALYYKGTKELWQEVVATEAVAGKHAPSDGTVQHVLNTAAAHGDMELAMQALDVLVERNVQMRVHHFEPIIDAYLSSKDVDGALRMLCVMKRAGLDPQKESTRSLFMWLREVPDQVESCFKSLEELKKSGYDIPVAAVNVLIEARCVSANISGAANIYAKSQKFLDVAPNSDTFRPFLEADALSAMVLDMAQESLRHSGCVPALPTRRLAQIARLAAKRGLFDVSGAYLFKIDELYATETCTTSSKPGEQAFEVPDAWVMHESEVRDIAQALLAVDHGRWSDLLAQIHGRNEALAQELRSMEKSAKDGGKERTVASVGEL